MQKEDKDLDKARKIYRAILLLLLLFFIGLFFSFHIISTNNGMVLIAKEHLSLNNTFIKLDAYLSKFNEKDLVERLSIAESDKYLINKLIEKDLISLEKLSASGKPDITYNQYLKIENGMTYNEVKNMLGATGNLMNSSNYNGIIYETYIWTSNYGGAISLTLKAGKVVAKTEWGLK